MTQTAMKMAELKENERHNRQQELIGTANVLSNAAGSLMSMYTKRIPSALKEAHDNAKTDFSEMGTRYNRTYSRERRRK